MALPSPPTNVKVDGKNEADGLATKAVARVTIEAELNDPTDHQKCRLVVWWSRTKNFEHHQADVSNPVNDGQRASLTLTELDQDTRYFYRLWTRDADNKDSDNPNTGNFWTNRSPDPPTLVLPVENETVDVTLNITFDWTPHDDDPSDPSSGYRLQYRTAGSVTPGGTGQPGDWVLVESAPPLGAFPGYTDPTTATLISGTFKANQFYEWRVRTRDQQGRWGEYSLPRSFFVSGTTKPPLLTEPLHGQGRVDTEDIEFRWRFRDPAPNQDQARADLRWRVVGTPDWITLFGDATTPGTAHRWTLPAGTFVGPGLNIEWQVRTYNRAGLLSDWSDSGEFWTAKSPGSSIVEVDPALTVSQGTLGCGEYRVFVYDQGGEVLRGEITPASQLTFRRLRDDISNCVISTNGFSDDCGALLKKVRSWVHELKVFRDGIPVWEGPVTRITYSRNGVEFEAKDVMAYVYRRILRQGFNDSWRRVDGEQVGLPTVVQRARQVIIDCLARHDPNVLGFMTTFDFRDDAVTSRVVPDYSVTGWEIVDDLAANAGLDYTVMGRRIILWDTHRPTGRLPEMRDGDFSDPPVVTEYGMQLCNYFAVTNNSGVWGAARPKKEAPPNEFYGPIEMLASAYGESDGGGGTALTRPARDRLENALEGQAKRNIAHRWPTPVVVRVPDNSALSPDANVGFQQLVPGVWIPIRSSGPLREVAQWQKLDSVTVTASPQKSEQVQVVMSPAPDGGDDPDAGETDPTEAT